MKKLKIVGREKEKKILQRILHSKKAEFLALYGRRRVGKTFLIKNFFEQSPCTLIYTSGIKGGSLRDQLTTFARVVGEALLGSRNALQVPQSWMEAFELLTTLVQKPGVKGKIVLFLDELPWLASKKSGCLQALDHYWNRYWSHNVEFKLVVCGSAASWILSNIIQNKGGLYNRITAHFCLKPFNLKESAEFLASKGVRLGKKQVLEIYLATGGIPYYLSHIEKHETAAEALSRLAFSEEGVLYRDFDILFASLFDNAEVCTEVVRLLAAHRYGVDREELFDQVPSLSRGGYATKLLHDLENAGFIVSFVPYGRKRRGTYVRLVDEYIFFYLKWIEPIRLSSQKLSDHSKAWISKRMSPSWKAWSGYAFETLCYKHIEQIQKALKLENSTIAATWRHVGKGEDRGAQIDLLFDREDGAVTVCEIKYTEDAFKIDKAYYAELQRKIEVYKRVTKTKKEIFLAMVTAAGLKKSLYSEECVAGVVTLSDLFAS